MARCRINRPLTVGLLCLTLLGCAASPPARVSDGAVTAALIHESVQENLRRVQTLRGSGTLAVESPEMAGSGSFELSLRKPDSVLLKFEGPFGIDVGSALITRTEFLFYNSIQNQVVSGSTSAANLSRFLRMNVTFDDLMNLFAGGVFFSEDEQETEELTTEQNQYVLTYRRADRTRRYWIDPATLLVQRIHHLDANGKLVAEQQYTNYRRVGDVSFPSTVRLVLNTERRILSVHYSRVDLNTTALSFTLDIPGNARRIQIQ